MEEHDTFFVSFRALIYDKEKKALLLMEDANTEGDFYKKFGPWETPGGRIHKKEDIEEALRREVEEETGLKDFEIGGVVAVGRSPVDYVTPNGAVSGLDVSFLIYYRGGDVVISPEHSGYKWIELREISEGKYQKWLKKRVEQLSVFLKNDEYLNDLKRTQADFENYKKRIASDRTELSSHLTKAIISDLVPILDNFHAAVTHVPDKEKGSPWVTGITYIEKQFEDVLANYGVKPLEVKPGDEFDPTKHEAVEIKKQEEGRKEQEKEKIKGHIIEKVVQKGYQIGDKVIRAAKVIVK